MSRRVYHFNIQRRNTTLRILSKFLFAIILLRRAYNFSRCILGDIHDIRTILFLNQCTVDGQNLLISAFLISD